MTSEPAEHSVGQRIGGPLWGPGGLFSGQAEVHVAPVGTPPPSGGIVSAPGWDSVGYISDEELYRGFGSAPFWVHDTGGESAPQRAQRAVDRAVNLVRQLGVLEEPQTAASESTAAATDRVLDEIDALVDEQMANYGRRSGYDHNVSQAQCPHCHEPWHGLKITRRMQEMRRAFGELTHYYEDEAGAQNDDERNRALAKTVEGYNHANDDSEVLCPGSTYEGEWNPPTVSGFAQRYLLGADSQPYSLSSLERLRRWSVSVGSWRLPDDPLTPLARPEPRWWRCEDAALLRSGRIRMGYQRDQAYDSLPDSPRRYIIRDEQHCLTVGDERIELTGDEDGTMLVQHARTRGDLSDLIALDIHCVAPPTVGGWLLRETADPPQTPQQRALPRPSTTPPMWAVDETRRRRRR